MQYCDSDETFGWRHRVRDALARKPNPIEVHIPDIEDAAAVKYMVESDKAAIDACGALVVYPWKVSCGTAMEAIYAWERGKYIVLVEAPGISPWHRYHSTYTARDVDGAVRQLKRWAAAVKKMRPA